LQTLRANLESFGAWIAGLAVGFEDVLLAALVASDSTRRLLVLIELQFSLQNFEAMFADVVHRSFILELESLGIEPHFVALFILILLPVLLVARHSNFSAKTILRPCIELL